MADSRELPVIAMSHSELSETWPESAGEFHLSRSLFGRELFCGNSDKRQ